MTIALFCMHCSKSLHLKELIFLELKNVIIRNYASGLRFDCINTDNRRQTTVQ